MRYQETDPIRVIPGIGEVTQSALDRLGIRKISDLVGWYPRVYIDGSRPYPIASLPLNQLVAIRVRILSCKVRPSKARGLRLTEATAVDETGQIILRWFNQPYLVQKLELGTEWIMLGIPVIFGRELVMTSPLIESEPKILAIYGQTKGVTSKMLRGYIGAVINTAEVKEDLPPLILNQEGLVSRATSLRMLHQPQNLAEVELGRAHAAFAEVFWFFARLLNSKRLGEDERGSIITYNIEYLQKIVAGLPFELTAGQKKAIWDSVQDIASGKVMTRLLNGDVGSGKTAVAGVLAAVLAKAGYQTILLAPTEILAKQHQDSLSRLFVGVGLKVALWTAAQKDDLAEVELVVGTHAVLQNAFSLPRLGLVVIDEQHRFGVRQRNLLRSNKENVPHFLSMTATPIPRTLALALYSDMSVSILPEKPKDRLPISTHIVRSARDKALMHQRILTELKAGHQVFVICPLIEEKKKEVGVEGGQFQILSREELVVQEQKTVVAEVARLQKEYPEYGLIEAVHGKLKAEQKREVMERMATGQINVLVATSVVEVGVDVPNATVMLIEGAERFGLAQLHQFRGRVGRGKDQSCCFLSPLAYNQQIAERLQILVDFDSGFAVAERDLALRGPGELGGEAQSGLPDFRMASLTDIAFLQRVKGVVEHYMNEHPEFREQYADFLYSNNIGLD